MANVHDTDMLCNYLSVSPCGDTAAHMSTVEAHIHSCITSRRSRTQTLRAQKLMLCAGGDGPGNCPRAAPRSVLAAEAAKVEEISRLTAEPLFVRAHNGVGGVWQSKPCHTPALFPTTGHT